MKIIVLGSGPADSIPRLGCECLACQDARKPKSRSKRTRSSVILKIKNKNVLIDASPDFKEQIKRERIKSIDAVLITHGHQDAIGGFKKNSAFENLKVFAERKTIDKIRKFKKNLAFETISPNKVFEVFGISIIPFRVRHAFREREFPTVGFRIGDFVYASDASRIPSESEKYLKSAKIVFLDAAMWFGRKIKWHLNAEEAIELAERLKIKTLYLTQIGHSYPRYNQAAKEIKKFCQKEKITAKVVLAYDGLRL